MQLQSIADIEQVHNLIGQSSLDAMSESQDKVNLYESTVLDKLLNQYENFTKVELHYLIALYANVFAVTEDQQKRSFYAVKAKLPHLN